MVVNATTLHNKLNDTEINDYKSPYDIQQCAQLKPYKNGYDSSTIDLSCCILL